MPEIKGERIISGQVTETQSSDGAISEKLRNIRNQVYGIDRTGVKTAVIVDADTLPPANRIDFPASTNTTVKVSRLNPSDSGPWASLVALRSKRRRVG